jgi:3-oxoacyl-[acyl-carrier protein] reductase
MNENSKVIIVTGGSRGIGRAICLALTEAGTRIYFNYYSPSDPQAEAEAAAETERLIVEAGGVPKSQSVNIASMEETDAFLGTVLKEAGRIDVLVNNAGITKDTLLVRMKEADWDAVMTVNLKGAFNCTRLVAKTMMKQRSGSIISLASIVGVTGNAGQANYASSKAGLIGFTKSVAQELAPRGITVNAIAPGFIETDMTVNLSDKVKQAMLAQIPLGRAGQAADVAAAVKFLASESASYITGQVIHVSGGMYM